MMSGQRFEFTGTNPTEIESPLADLGGMENVIFKTAVYIESRKHRDVLAEKTRASWRED